MGARVRPPATARRADRRRAKPLLTGLRLAVNLLNGSTPAGVAIALAGRARPAAWRDGLLIAHGYRLPVPSAPAFCLGGVIITRLDADAAGRAAGLLRHEARHATQYAWCCGLLMLPLYFAAAALSWVLTGDYAAANAFERRAGLADGGYQETPLRPAIAAPVSKLTGRSRDRASASRT